MRLCQATLREIQMPLVRPFETSFGRTTVRRILLVEANVDGAIGWGECVAGEASLLRARNHRDRLADPARFHLARASGKEFASAAEVWECSRQSAATTWPRAPRSRHMGRRGEAKGHAALEAARRRAPGDLLRRLHRHSGDDDELERTVERELAAGYQRIKIKIKPGYDVAARGALAPALSRKFA